MAFIAFASCWSSAGAYGLRQKENPIRRIVTLLQDMQKEIETEGKKEEKAYDKFMCYCDGNTDGMKAAAEAGSQKATELSSKLEALKAEGSAGAGAQVPPVFPRDGEAGPGEGDE